MSVRESSSGSVFQFELKKHCLLIHKIIQNVPQSQFSTLTCNYMYTYFPFHIMPKLIRHYILALRCLHCFEVAALSVSGGGLCTGFANQGLI